MIKLRFFVLALAFGIGFSCAASAAQVENLSQGKKYTVTAKEPVAAYEEIGIRDYPDTKGGELTDGLVAPGAENFKDPNFVGYLRQAGRDIVIDLGRMASVSDVKARFMASPNLGINYPASMAVSVSDDGKLWSTPISTQIQEGFFAEICTVSVKPNSLGRYVKVYFPVNVWVFTDEITVWGTWEN